MGTNVGDTIDKAAEQALQGDRSHAPDPNHLWNDAYAELVKGATVRIVDGDIHYADGAELQVWNNKINEIPGSLAAVQGAAVIEEPFDGSPAKFDQKLQEFSKLHGQPVSSGIGEVHANRAFVYKTERTDGSDAITSLQVRDRVGIDNNLVIKLETNSLGKSMEFWHADGKQSHRLEYSGKLSLTVTEASLDTNENGSTLHTERTFDH
jgi:hypothetical protein